MTTRPAKDALFDALASVAKTLSSGRRAEIVELLAQAERPVDAIAVAIEQSVANTSNHLQQLNRAGLVISRREGTRIYYRLASPRVAELWAAMRDVAASHVAGLEPLAAAYLGDRSSVRPIARDELLRRIRDANLIILDVRPEAEFDAGHITGAISAPIASLPHRLADLDRAKEIVAYCRGPYCVYADEAVRTLTKAGFRAWRLEDGFPEWRRADLPTRTPAHQPAEDRGVA